MKYVFFGSPRFAEIVLKQLIDAGMPPTAVVANPDRPVGRKQTMTAPPTTLLARDRVPHVKIFQPENLTAISSELRAMNADFFVVAAYAKIIPKAILDIPRLGTLGVHPSLLPKYRGASPIQSAIQNGEKETGTTIYLMDEKMDHGHIVAKDVLPVVGDANYTQLEEELARLSGKLLVKTIPNFVAGKITPRLQDETQATFTKKFKTEDGFIDERELAAAEQGDGEKAKIILQKINALNPEPGAWTMRNGKRLKLLKAKIDGDKLVLLETQREGEKAKTIRYP